MNVKATTILAAFALLVVAERTAPAQSASEPSPVITDPEAYAVYAAVLPRSVLQENHPEPLAIQLETIPGPEGCRRGCESTHTVGLRKKDGRWDSSGIGCHGIA
jgi:hypothetical protein